MNARPIRILYLINSFGAGGAETNVARLAAHFHRRPDFHVRVGCFTASGPNFSSIAAEGIPWHQLAGPRGVRRGAALRYFRALSSHIKAFKPDIVHGFLMPMDILAAFAAHRAGTPLAVSAKRSVNPWEGSELWRRLDRWSGRRWANLILCNSPAVADSMKREGFPPEKIRVVDNGVRPKALKKIGGADEGKAAVILGLGRLRRHKGYHTLVEAAALAAGARPLSLILGGEGPESDALKKAAMQRGVSLSLPGHVSDLDSFWEKGEIFVLPSAFEGFSNVLLEAMNSGRCCVATDIPENRRLIEDGVSGRLFPVGDAMALARILSELLEDGFQRARIGAEANRTAARNFSLDAMFEATEKAYREGLEAAGWTGKA